MCHSAGRGDLQPAPGFLGQPLVVEVFSAPKQRSWSEGPRGTQQPEMKTQTHPSLMPLKQNNPVRQRGRLAKGGLGALCCFFPSHLAPSLPAGAGGAGGDGVVTSCPPLLWLEEPGQVPLAPWPATAKHRDSIPCVTAVFLKNRSKLWPRKSHGKWLGLSWS